MPSDIQHIAVIRLSALGDVAMTIPVLKAFTKQHPDVKITMVSRKFLEPLFEDIPNLIFFPFDENRHNGISGLVRLYFDLKKMNIDAVADLHNVIRSKIVTTLFRLIGKKAATLDKARKEKKALTRKHNKIFRQLKPMTQRYADVFRKLGFIVDLSNPKFAKRQSQTADLLRLTGTKERKWIGIAPFAKHQSKVYPADLMKKVIDELACANVRIFLFGSRSETPKLAQLAGSFDNILIAAGKLNFEQELHLISDLDLMLSMDSGNAHLAAIYGIPTITLWGATHPFAGFAPFGQPEDHAIVSDREKYDMLPTSVYGNKKVEGYEDAMRTISPETVIAKIKAALKSDF